MFFGRDMKSLILTQLVVRYYLYSFSTDGFAIKMHTKVDIPLNKKINT